MRTLTFPINFTFKISTFTNDFTAQDARGQTVAYVKQKLFKLKEAITIFDDESQTNVAYKINADKWIDFSAAYTFRDSAGTEIGKIGRQGWASIWKAKYDIFDQHQKLQFIVREENAWVKVMDSILGSIPVVSAFTGYLFNPTYIVLNTNNQPVVRLVKEPSFFGRKFQVRKIGVIDEDDGERIMLGLIMMILLERRRG